MSNETKQTTVCYKQIFQLCIDRRDCLKYGWQNERVLNWMCIRDTDAKNRKRFRRLSIHFRILVDLWISTDVPHIRMKWGVSFASDWTLHVAELDEPFVGRQELPSAERGLQLQSRFRRLDISRISKLIMVALFRIYVDHGLWREEEEALRYSSDIILHTAVVVFTTYLRKDLFMTFSWLYTLSLSFYLDIQVQLWRFLN